jgi:poly-gamma-glutamate capsule biosynthesis protein CapA/YwtB (metallophosphatase superfamily)
MRTRIVFWGTVFGIVLFALTATSFAQATDRPTSPSALPPLSAPLSLPFQASASHRVSLVAPLAAGRLKSTPAFQPRHFTVLGAGDVLLHPGFWAQARRDARKHHMHGYDFDPVFASAVPDIKGADLAICHMETPYGSPDGPFTGFPIFEVPPQIAGTLHRVGYDTCSTASNHSLDGGAAGITRTLNALDAAGVKHTGTARSAAEAATPDILNVNGVKVAQLSYAFGFNGLIRPPGKPWLANLIDERAILAAAHRAKKAGAEVVIVSLHFGTEYQQTPNAQQLAVAKALLASPDVDLILGCHAHVVQPFQQINGKWVVYGMGNQVAEQGFSRPTMDGVMSRFTFTEIRPHVFRVTKAEAIPTYMDLGHPQRLIDLPRALATHLSEGQRDAYQASWNRTAREVKSLGAPGLVVLR